VTRRIRRRGERGISRKTIAQGRRNAPTVPVCSCALAMCILARETAGAASTRRSLRPLLLGAKRFARPGRNAPRECGGVFCDLGRRDCKVPGRRKPLAMTALLQTHLRIPAARFARALQIVSPKEKRAQGTPGACCTRGLVCKGVQKTHTSIQVQSEHPGIPCTMVLRLMPCSPRRRIRLVTVIGGLKVLSGPVGPTKTSANLTPATGARTTRFCRTPQHRSSARRQSLTSRSPPCESKARPTLPRPPHLIPTCLTIRIRPLVGDETVGFLVLIWEKWQEEYFLIRGLTGQITLNRLTKSRCARRL